MPACMVFLYVATAKAGKGEEGKETASCERQESYLKIGNCMHAWVSNFGSVEHFRDSDDGRRCRTEERNVSDVHAFLLTYTCSNFPSHLHTCVFIHRDSYTDT